MKRRFELQKALTLMIAVSIVVLAGVAACAVYFFRTGVSPTGLKGPAGLSDTRHWHRR